MTAKLKAHTCFEVASPSGNFCRRAIVYLKMQRRVSGIVTFHPTIQVCRHAQSTQLFEIYYHFIPYISLQDRHRR